MSDRVPDLHLDLERIQELLEEEKYQEALDLFNDLAVGDQVQAGFELLPDDLDRDLVLDLRQLLWGDLAAIQAGDRLAEAGGPRPVGYLRVASCDCRLHDRVLQHLFR